MIMADSVYVAEKLFYIVKLLQRGFSSDFLLSKGYEPELIDLAQQIRAYLFVCFRNAKQEPEKNEN